MRPARPGAAFMSGAAALGWGLGAVIGLSLRKAAVPGTNDNDLTVLVVSDGTFLFCIPSAAYWIARQYQTVSSPHRILWASSLTQFLGLQPFLTIVLNNGGWRVCLLSPPRL